MEYEEIPNQLSSSNITLTDKNVTGVSPAILTDHEMDIYNVVKIIRNIFIPVIVIVGGFGNCLIMLVFTSNYLRRSSSSTFSTALACADTIFLITLFITWYDGFVNNILTSPEKCRLVIYITYTTSFISVWFVVCFTMERYIAICKPLRAKVLCTQTRERLAVVVCLVFALMVYSFSFWTTDISSTNDVIRCSYKREYMDLFKIITWVDTTFTMILPLILIFMMNMRVACKTSRFKEKREKCLSPHEEFSLQNHTLRSKQQMRVTRTLLLVSTAFLVLNLPSHAFKLINLIEFFTTTKYHYGMIRYLIQEICQIFYYSSFSINLFLYSLKGKHFQKSLKLMYEGVRLKFDCIDRTQYLERTNIYRKSSKYRKTSRYCSTTNV